MVPAKMGAEAAKSNRMVVYGAGGHGRVVADAAAAAGYEVLGFLDDRVAAGTRILAWPVVGDLSWLEGNPDVAVAHGIGDNAVRQQIAWSLKARGITFASVVHPRAVLSPHAQLGSGAVVMALAVLNPGARVGAGVIINTGAVIEHDVVVGDFAHVASNASLAGSARIDRLALLGTGASVLPGRSIGAGSVVGAGAVVTRDVPPGSIAAGVPARILRSTEKH